VVCKWIGNSQSVAAKHYLQVTDEDFAKAVQNPVQQVSAQTRTGSHAEQADSSEPHVCGSRQGEATPCEDMALAGMGRSGLEQDGATTGEGSNLRDSTIRGGAESGADRAENAANEAGRLEVIADLLAGLPAAQRASVIAELGPAERATVARLLVTKGPREGGR